MTRSTIVFGNGLGMSIDPARFSLQSALQAVWNDDDVIDPAQRTLIRGCLPSDRNNGPMGEHDLGTLQVALSSCDELRSIQPENTHWLTQDGMKFPRAVREYIHRVAKQFHDSISMLPEEFTQELIKFVRKTRSHIATLNYDNLLYGPFIDERILSGYDGHLVDGFLETKGFQPSNLVRLYGKDFGYYMHLHGSPLFVQRNDGAYKLRRCDAPSPEDGLGAHIVLTHFKHKPRVIESSIVLSTYWRYLRKALGESSRLFVIGYSGSDEHFNDVVADSAVQQIRVVEWDGEGAPSIRRAFWKGALRKDDVDFMPMSCVTDFRNWT